MPGAFTHERVESLREELSLRAHPEGGFFSEHYRAAYTAIYYLLCDGAHSAWHRVAKDELWHHYEGAAVELHLIDEKSGYRRVLLGPVDKITRPSRLVPASTWQAARLCDENGYALVGNTVAPGFEFSDWTLADEATLRVLAQRHPDARDVLSQLSGKPR